MGKNATRTLLRWLPLLLLASVISMIGPAWPAQGQPVRAGNGFYTVYVEDTREERGVGTYAIATGPEHPIGNDINVFYRYPEGKVGSSFTTIHSYSSGTSYTQRNVGPAPAVVWLDDYGVVEQYGTTGYRTTYRLPGPPVTPDALTIISDVSVSGTTFEDSSVAVTTQVRNTGSAPVAIGVRYLWDFQIGADDGPTFQPRNPDGSVYFREREFVDPAFESFRIEDNDINANPPTFNVFGTVNGPFLITPTPRPPDLLQYVSWREAVGQPFTYQVDPDRLVAIDDNPDDTYVDDSATLHFFGHNRARAITLAAGDSATVSASVFAAPPPPVTIRLEPETAVNSIGSFHAVTATVTTSQGTPLAGQSVGLTVNGTQALTRTAVTGSGGTAVFDYTSNSAGTDSITAWVDLNGNGTRELTEPTGSARNTWEEPTAVELVAFTATSANGSVSLAWETGAEIDHAGFHLYRATSTDGPYTRVNPALIPARGDAVAGAHYSSTDRPGAGIFYYVLEDVDLAGQTTRHGPVMVQVAPAAANTSDQLYLPIVQGS